MRERERERVRSGTFSRYAIRGSSVPYVSLAWPISESKQWDFLGNYFKKNR
jgi:hypothetical protein